MLALGSIYIDPCPWKYKRPTKLIASKKMRQTVFFRHILVFHKDYDRKMAVLSRHIGDVRGLKKCKYATFIFIGQKRYATIRNNHDRKVNERTSGVGTFNALRLTAQ